MVRSAATTVQAYLNELPADRKKAIVEVRKAILKHLPKGYEEVMQWGMISYVVPLKTFPDTHNKQPLTYAALASQKNYMAVYIMTIYGKRETAFRDAYKKAGKKLNMGKCCIRFEKLEDLPLPIIGKEIASMSPRQYVTTFYKDRKAIVEKKKPGKKQ